jgi:uncharacterized membrane protein YkvI
MESFGLMLLVAACVIPFAAETLRDRWAMSLPVGVMVMVGVVLIVLS